MATDLSLADRDFLAGTSVAGTLAMKGFTLVSLGGSVGMTVPVGLIRGVVKMTRSGVEMA